MSLERWETAERAAVRLRFDDDADAYDRTRPVAPDAVFDDVMRLAELSPGSSVVEIGPGTGQATRRLAQRHVQVRALEIGSRLAARTRQNLAGLSDVTVEHTSFEAWDPGAETFDAVLACNAFHWVDPDVRFVKAAAVLKPSGHLVVLSTPVVIPQDAHRFWWDVQDDWAAVGVDREDPATKRPDLVGGYASAIDPAGRFTDPVVVRREFDVTLTAEEYATNLTTQSGVKELSHDAREQLRVRVQRRVEAQGGTLTVHHLAVLAVAQRAAS